MKIEMGKEYKTKGGQTVRILCVDRACNDMMRDYPVIALVGDDSQSVRAFTATGVSFSEADGLDLVEVKPKAVVHAVLYYKKQDPREVGGTAYSTEQLARRLCQQRNAVMGDVYHYWYERIEREVE